MRKDHREMSKISTDDVTLPDGTILTEADFERLADIEASATHDIDRLLERKRGRPPLDTNDALAGTVQVRLGLEMRNRLTERSRAEHRSTSAIVRDALDAWLRTAS
jgi:Ribbon-helix-helix protein, copG family